MLCLKEPSIFTGRTEGNRNVQLHFVGPHRLVPLSCSQVLFHTGLWFVIQAGNKRGTDEEFS